MVNKSDSCEAANVFGNGFIGIRQVSFILDPIIGAMREIRFQHLPCLPIAPKQTETLLEIAANDGSNGGKSEYADKEPCFLNEYCAVPALDCRYEVAADVAIKNIQCVDGN
jgi:hypothetical protein